MKITIYELLELVKDGKAPGKIKTNTGIFKLEIEDGQLHYRCNDGGILIFDYYIENNKLNNEVEIIEEEPKPIIKEIIEALGYVCGEIRKCFENGWNKSLGNKPLIEEDKKIEKIDEILRIDDLIPPYGENEYKMWKNIIIQQNKIDELIDEINNLKEK